MFILIKTFIISFLINDGRILFKIYGDYLKFIKYQLIIQNLGFLICFICFLINFSKGYFLIQKQDESFIYLAILILIGNYLGAKPGITGGSELMVLWGIWAGYNFALVQFALALFLGILLISKKFSFAVKISSLFILVKFILFKDYFVFIISFLTFFLSYSSIETPFIPLLNKIKKEKFT